MCYKTALDKKAEDIMKVTGRSFQFPEEFIPYKHNDAFTKPNVYIIPQDQPDKIYAATWGLVPDLINTTESTITPSEYVNRYKTFNARGEDFFEKRSYKVSAENQRCLILADGFYEPHHYKSKSQPFFCYLKNQQLFSFAGLYTKLDEALYTTTIVTVEANNTFKVVHNKKKRMPLVLDTNFEDDWISDLNKNQVVEIVNAGFTNSKFYYHPVTNEIYKNRTMKGMKTQEKVDAFDPQFNQESLF